jgi:circadian clock protein KaiB
MRQKESASGIPLESDSPRNNNLEISPGSRGKYVLKLYICGMTVRSTLAIENLQKICRDYLPDRCDLEIIDIFKNPAQARTAQVVAAPTLVKLLPLPVQRLIGSLSDTEKVLSGLDLISLN